MVSQNSINNTIAANDFSVNRSLAGTASVFSVNHTDNTSASSNAELRSQVGGTAGGDPFLRLSVSGGQDYSFGIDNTVSDDLVITDDASPSTGNKIWNMTTSGNIPMPKQPAFLAYQNTDDSNVTGAGTDYVLGTNTALTEVYDQGSNFVVGGAGPATFTAPVTGKYLLFYLLTLSTLTSATRANIRITTSNREYQCESCNPLGQVNSGTGNYTTCNSEFCDMDVADIYTCFMTNNGGAGDTVDVKGLIGGNITTAMAGYLVL